MQQLQQMQAEMQKEEREFATRMDGLRAKLEVCSKAHSTAEQRKARLEKEKVRIEKELAEAEVEINKQGALKQEITKSIVNMQTLRSEQQQGAGGAAAEPPGKAPTQAGWGASLGQGIGGLASSFMGAGAAPPKKPAPIAAGRPSAATAMPDLLGGIETAPAGGGAPPAVDLLGGVSFGAPPPPSSAPTTDLLGAFGAPTAPHPAAAAFGGSMPLPPAASAMSADDFAGFDGFDSAPAGMSGAGRPPPSAVMPPTDPFANLMM